MPVTDTLRIAEIPFDTGEVQFRYERYLADDGARWIRHGLFRSYGKDGSLRSEGGYEHGFESGVWCDYHANGQLAARGEYAQGQKHGLWRFWDAEGNEEQSAAYRDGNEIA